MPDLSVAIIAQDEEECLPWVLDCAMRLAKDLPLAEVVIVDGGSTDSTLTVIESYRNRLPIVLVSRPFDNFRNQKNTALEACSGDWVLGVDADMTWSPNIGALLVGGYFNKHDIWDFRLRYCRGDWLHFCRESGCGFTTRLWKNVGLRYEREVHEYLVYPGETGWNSHRRDIAICQEVTFFENSLLLSDQSLRNRGERYQKFAVASQAANIPVGGPDRYIEAKYAHPNEQLPPEIVRLIEHDEHFGRRPKIAHSV